MSHHSSPPRPLYRILQFVGQIFPYAAPDVDAALFALLSSTEWPLVRRLSPADRRHALALHQALLASGWRDRDVLTAALLHDIGKVDERGRVWLYHRVLKVLLETFAPGMLPSSDGSPPRWFPHGLILARNHPRIGAAMAHRAGASSRTCWLIAHHHDDTIQDDAALSTLRAIDERV